MKRLFYLGVVVLLILGSVAVAMANFDKVPEKPDVIVKEPSKNPPEPKKPGIDEIKPKEYKPDPRFTPKFREVVIVYFKEMPPSLEKFAAKYSGKLIFVKEDIKMAAFETNPVKEPGKTSRATLDFIERVSRDPIVEKAFEDEFMFVKVGEKYKPEPKVVYPEEMKDDYIPDEVIVDFWRMPPSLEEFATKYDAKIKRISNVLMSATFEVNNISEFIRKVSADPYVMDVTPNGLGFYGDYTPNDPRWNQQWCPKKIHVSKHKVYPENLEKQGIKKKEILNRVIVGFWRLPPSLDEFAARYGGRLVEFNEADRALLTAYFETNNVTEFIKNVSKDPYVRSAAPDVAYRGLSYTPKFR